MKHLFFASHLEAQPFIKSQATKINDSFQVYDEDDYHVIIIGTGLVTASCNTTKYLSSININQKDHFINLGIAGAVHTELKIGSVHKISSASIYCSEYIPETSLNIWQSSYPKLTLENTDGLNLASSLHPIWGGKFIPTLKIQKADLVDMEGYAFTKACQDYNIVPTLYKAVSDNLMKQSQNEFLKDAQFAAYELFSFYNSL